MSASPKQNRRRAPRRLFAALALGFGVILAASPSASAAVTASFFGGVLTVTGDAAPNSIMLSRDAAGTILVNGGAITVSGGTPTVANTSLIRALGLAGNDRITLDESLGALPAAQLFGGANNDALIGGSSADQLFGQSGADTLQGKGGNDQLFGGTENDTLTGGDADDQVFGEEGGDRMIWNPGDDTDLNEGDDGVDTVEVNGGNGSEQFRTTANGARVRFDRVDPAPFSIDIGTSENLVLHAHGGEDDFSSNGNLAVLLFITVDGGAGLDTLLGGNGPDHLLGGDDADLVDGNQGNDSVQLGAGDDTFQWDPEDGSDTVAGEAGTDTLLVNGDAVAETFVLSRNGDKLRFTRNVGSVVLDVSRVENVQLRALGGADRATVNDLTGVRLKNVSVDLGFGGDGVNDRVTVNGTAGNDHIAISGGIGLSVTGLAAAITITNPEATKDRLDVNTLAGTDTVNFNGAPQNQIQLFVDGVKVT